MADLSALNLRAAETGDPVRPGCILCVTLATASALVFFTLATAGAHVGICTVENDRHD